VAESYSDNKISFQEDAFSTAGSSVGRVNSETWEPLEKLAKGEVREFSIVYCMLRNVELVEMYGCIVDGRLFVQYNLQLVNFCFFFFVFTFNCVATILILICTGLAKIVSVHCEEVRGAQGNPQELARQV